MEADALTLTLGGRYTIDKVRAKKKPVLAFATAYTTDSYQLASHASEVWADPIGGVAIVFQQQYAHGGLLRRQRVGVQIAGATVDLLRVRRTPHRRQRQSQAGDRAPEP